MGTMLSSRPRRQRGAISVLAAVTLSAALAAALLAIDLGNVYYTKRRLQTVADTAALSAVNDPFRANSIALDTAAANGFVLPGTPGNSLNTRTGSYDYTTRNFSADGSPEDWNAVEVTVITRVPYFFMVGGRDVRATATATRSDIAGLSIGSGLVQLDTKKSALLNGLLGGLLNTSINLDVMSYRGLVNTDVRLLDLVKAKASVGTVQELLALDLELSELLRLTATALTQTDIATVDAKAIDALNLLALRVPGGLHLKMGDLLDASLAPGNSAAEARINLLQLVTLAAQVANGKNFVNIPVAGLDLGGLAQLKVAFSLIEPPQLAIGPPGQDSNGNWRTQAHTSQWRLKLDLTLLGDLEGGLVHVPLYLEIAAADVKLKSIDCRYPRNDSIVTTRVDTSLVRAYVGEVNKDAMTNVTKPATVKPATIVNVLGLITVDAQAQINFPGAGGDLAFNGPFDAKNTKTASGLSTSGLFNSLADNLVLDVKLLGLELGLGGLLKSLHGLLDPVFALLDSLLAPVLSLLGIQLGYADVTAFHLQCGVPQLVR